MVIMHATHVVVAGAGLAGLSAAHQLSRAGARVTLIDAREYAGGRVRTIRDFAAGQHAELGGEFVEPEHKELLALCSEFGLRLVRVLRSGFTHRFRDEHGTYHLSRTAPWDALAQTLSPLIRRYKIAGGDNSADAVRDMATLSLRDYLRQSNAPQKVHAMATALRGFFLADPDEISVLPVVEQIAKGGSPAQTEFFRIEGGNDRLVDALVRDTPARLLLRHTIRAVAHAVDRVVVSVTDAAGLAQEIEGDYLVMTLPASTLRDVEMRPALPEHQQHAIRRLSYGRATKALVQSSSNLFGSRHARAFATDGPVGAFWDGSEPLDVARGEEPGTDASIVVFLAGGSASGPVREMAASGGGALLSDLCWLGMNRAPVTAVHLGDWTADPWARGGYAFIDPGFDPAWRPLLAKRAGRIVFAGEHTSERWQGYMNGAVETGQRAARELLRDLGR
jgi:monoamine oxidase